MSFLSRKLPDIDGRGAAFAAQRRDCHTSVTARVARTRAINASREYLEQLGKTQRPGCNWFFNRGPLTKRFLNRGLDSTRRWRDCQ